MHVTNLSIYMPKIILKTYNKWNNLDRQKSAMIPFLRNFQNKQSIKLNERAFFFCKNECAFHGRNIFVMWMYVDVCGYVHLSRGAHGCQKGG